MNFLGKLIYKLLTLMPGKATVIAVAEPVQRRDARGRFTKKQ